MGMKTGPVMGSKSSSVLMLSFLLIAALCSNASIITKILSYPGVRMTWTEARRYCQQHHVDLVTWKLANQIWVATFLKDKGVQQAWIGLLRDPKNDLLWRWLNLKSGQRPSVGDLLQSSDWADGQQSSHCAFVNADLKWASERCSQAKRFYCSQGRNIVHHTNALDWYKASQYCRDKYNDDLATITATNTDQLLNDSWIGLYREAGEIWSWVRDQPSDYRNWAKGQPLTLDCGSVQTDTILLHSSACSSELHFVCYDDNLVVVNEKKTWEDAMLHCRKMTTPCKDPKEPCIYHHKLVSPMHLSDYSYIRDRIYRATTDEVWTGLRFLAGEWWMDGRILQDQVLPNCPSQSKHCGTLSKYDTNNWIIRDCSERRNFICSREKILITNETRVV